MLTLGIPPVRGCIYKLINNTILTRVMHEEVQRSTGHIMEMSRLMRDGTAGPVSRDQVLGCERGQGNIIFLVQLTTCRIVNLLPRWSIFLLYVSPCIHRGDNNPLFKPTGTTDVLFLASDPPLLCIHCHTCNSKRSMDQPGKVANPARGHLNRGNEYFPVRVRA